MNWRVTGACVIAAAGVAVLTRAALQLTPRASGSQVVAASEAGHGRGGPSAHEEPGEGFATPIQDAPGAFGQTIAAKARAQRVPETIALAGEKVLRAYLAETSNDFNKELEQMGIAPWGKPGDTAAWQSFHSLVAASTFDPSAALIRPRVVGGEAVNVSDPSNVRSAERPQARPEWAAQPAEAFVVLIPGTFKALGGQNFKGRLGFELARRPGTSEWALLRVRLYDTPNGLFVPGFPI
jgi:hypothetical protein